MRPWMGAVAVAAAMLVAPSVALAGQDDPAFMKFKLASSADYDDFERLGLNMGHNVENGGGDSIIVNAWVTDEQLAMVRAHGYEDVGVLDDKYNIDRIRAERDKDAGRDQGRHRRAGTARASAKGKSAAGDIHAQRADYYENLGGRWLSIEANVDGAPTPAPAPTPTPARPSWPTSRRGGQPHRQPRHRRRLHRPRRQPALLPVPHPDGPAGRAGRRRRDARQRQGLVLQRRPWTRSPSRSGSPRTRPAYAPGFKTVSSRTTTSAYEAYQKMRDLAARVPEHLPGDQAAGADDGLPAQGADDARLQRHDPVRDVRRQQPAGRRRVAPATATQPSTVVLTSKTFGHLGGNSLAAQIVAPAAGANNQALSVALAGNKININPATDATGAVTSTANAGRRRDQRPPDASRPSSRPRCGARTPVPASSWPARRRR